MTTNEARPVRSDLAPRYVAGPRRGAYLAQFESGRSLEIEPGRGRAYPGLRGEAPSMIAFYEAFADFVGTGRVLDAGCGAGNGTRCLLKRGLEVVAVDADENAIAFAREISPAAEHHVTDLANLDLGAPFAGAVVADVLSQSLEPEAALLAIGRALRPGAALLVAEPAAHASQRLSAPQRRAFSVARLRSLLVRTGFEIEAVLCDRVPFVALLAKAQNPHVADAFARAYSLAATGRFDEALKAIDMARRPHSLAVEIEVLLAEAEIYLALGDGDRAANACFSAQKLAPTDARPLVGLGRIALSSGTAADALHLALEALRHDPTEAAAYALAGVAADALGNSEAVTAWRAAAQLAPDDELIVGELARMATGPGDQAMALAALDRLERYGASLDTGLHVRRGFLLLAAGRHSDAATEVRIASAKNADPTELAELKQAIARARPAQA